MGNLSWWKRACAVFALCAATGVAANAQTFDNLLDFDSTNGDEPDYVSLAQGVDGNFYGTTLRGGCQFDCGTIFKISSGGVLTTLHTFGETDGALPFAGLVRSTDGNFYGTTCSGGATGYGTVFKITSGGTLTTLHSFDASDGACPGGPLLQATNGSFYGTTVEGGDVGGSCPSGCGTVFRITSGGTLTTLHSFKGPDGDQPYGGLIQARDGNFYGTTSANSSPFVGSVFKITSRGTLTTLHKFEGDDGALPYAGLVQTTDGNFYGTTSGGGANGDGTIFRITPGGHLVTLHVFNSHDGSSPIGGLVQATDGRFYGTTEGGGSHAYGTIFAITSGGTFATLHTFTSADGASPIGELLQDTSGKFYGTTYAGGDLSCTAPYGCGTVFSLDTGLSPFVAFVRAAGKVGQTGPILGQALTGTTNVTLNGIPATFTVVSDTLIKATVPAGATTGYVTVTTPSGTLTSNVPFHVIK